MQCVERELLNLDDDVSEILPELRDIKVLEGFDESGKPKLKRAERRITSR